MKIQLVVEYPGHAFSGWQAQVNQPELRTVQGELERALQIFFLSEAKKNGVVFSSDERILVIGSGRTDAGVHALGQVASFAWPVQFAFDAERLRAALNGITMPELVIHQVQEQDDGFDARFAQHEKCYVYRLMLRDTRAGYFQGRVWCVYPLKVAPMIEAARRFCGQHDFSSFRAKDCTASSTIRTLIISELTRVSNDELQYWVQGKGFLKQMIRIIVGTLVEVGRGKLSVDDISRIIAARDRGLAGPSAPACGLTLRWVRYGEKAETLSSGFSKQV